MSYTVLVDALSEDVRVGIISVWTDEDGNEHETTVEFDLPPRQATDLGLLLLDRAGKVGEPQVPE